MLGSLGTQTWQPRPPSGQLGEDGGESVGSLREPERRASDPSSPPSTCSAGQCLPRVSHRHRLLQGLTHLSAAPG